MPCQCWDGFGSTGDVGHTSYLPKTDQKEYRDVRSNLKEKWLNLWKTRDKLLNRMNRLVWYPSLFLHGTSWTGIFSDRQGTPEWDGLPLAYLVCGSTDSGHIASAQAGTGFYIQEKNLLMNTLSDYVEHVRTWVEEVPVAEKPKRSRERRNC